MPSTLLLISMTCTSKFSASFHRPQFFYVDIKFAMLVNVFDQWKIIDRWCTRFVNLEQIGQRGAIAWPPAPKIKNFRP
jgi:hypothetical protein